MTVIWTDKVDLKSRRALIAGVAVVALLVAAALGVLLRPGPSPSDRCVAKLPAHDVLRGTPIVENLPGGDVQVNGRFYDPVSDTDLSFLCTVHGSTVDLVET